MPRAFTKMERESIKESLFTTAEQYLSMYGARKTTVDELVRAAKISKGTFYQFFASKEMLFFELFCLKHDAVHEKFFNQIEKLKNLNADQLTEIIFALFQELDRSFLFSFVYSGDLEVVMRKLPLEVIATHNKRDDKSIEKLFAKIHLNPEKIQIYSGALRLAFVTILHKKEAGKGFEEAFKLLIRGILIQMLKENDDDQS